MVRLVLAKKSDLSKLAKILSRAFTESNRFYSFSQAKKCVQDLFSKNPKTCFCITEKRELVGLVFCRSSFWQTKKLKINEFAVAPTAQKKGIGSRALKELQKWAKKEKFSSVLLTTDQKSPAFWFYQKNGFKKTDYVTMEKAL